MHEVMPKEQHPEEGKEIAGQEAFELAQLVAETISFKSNGRIQKDGNRSLHFSGPSDDSTSMRFYFLIPTKEPKLIAYIHYVIHGDKITEEDAQKRADSLTLGQPVEISCAPNDLNKALARAREVEMI